MKAIKADLARTVKQVERLIAPLKIDTIRLTHDEARRLEHARRALAKVTGTPYP